MAPDQLLPGDPRLAATITLIQRVFAEHDGRIDPPSSMHRLTLGDLERSAAEGEVWAVGAPPVACVILSMQGGALYLSKLAVAPGQRGTGLARTLVTLSEQRAAELGADALELQTRVELTENHALFAAMGFKKIAETAHPGYDRPTSIRMRKPLTQFPDARG